MRKVALFLAIILVIAMPLTVSATPRALGINPTLAFDGTTATCEVAVVGNNMSEHIEVVMKLMHGTSCVKAWMNDDYGYVYMLAYANVTKGQTYSLVIEVKVNGVAQQPVSIQGTC